MNPDLPAEDQSPTDLSLDQVWTVVGVFPESKERYVEHVHAPSPRMAEDLAQLSAKERGGVLWICAVFDGQFYASDTYATFVDPDMTTEAEY